jgi:hypothetical protein
MAEVLGFTKTATVSVGQFLAENGQSNWGKSIADVLKNGHSIIEPLNEASTVAVVGSVTPPVVEMVTITKAEYERLLEDSHWLQCLQAAGVDNWIGFDDAREIQIQDQNH